MLFRTDDLINNTFLGIPMKSFEKELKNKYIDTEKNKTQQPKKK